MGDGLKRARRAAQNTRPATEREEHFGSWLEDLLRAKGWRFMHPRPALDTRRKASGVPQWRTALEGDKGWPDYACVRRGRFLLIEVKSSTGTLSEEQKMWRDDLLEAGIEWYCFKPHQRVEIWRLLS